MAISSMILLCIFTVFATYSSHARSVAMQITQADLGLTIQFTATYPIQTPPTSTVFGAIVTNILKVVDCDYVQVENIDHNSPQEGQYFYRTTIPVLTRYHVTCMDPSTVVTRQAEIAVATERPQVLDPLHASSKVHREDKRTSHEATSLDTLLSVAERLSSGIDPTNENITVRDFKYLLEINTALFALNIVNSGLPLADMCRYMQDPTIANNLQDNYINQKQAADIICFASVYGLDLGQSNDEVLANLAALEYAVQMHAYHSNSVQDACRSLSYSAGQMLGIDVDGIQQNVCNGTAGISISSTHPSVMTTASASLTPSALPFPNATLGTAWSGQGTGTSWPTFPPNATSGPLSNIPVAATSSATEISNITVTPTTSDWQSTDSPQSSWIINTGSSVIFGTGGSVFSSATSAAGTVAPWFNVTTPASAPAVGSASVMSTGRAMPSEGTTQGPSFYVPPRSIRDRLRRHG